VQRRPQEKDVETSLSIPELFGFNHNTVLNSSLSERIFQLMRAAEPMQ